MLRRNPQTGVWERKEGTQWVPTPTEHSLDVALDDAFADLALDNGSDAGDTAAADARSGSTGALPTDVGSARDGDAGVGAGLAAPMDAAAAANAPTGSADAPSVDVAALAAGAGDSGPARGQPGRVDGSADLPDWSIPGLVSTESQRGTGGQKSLRQRLQDRAQRTRGKAQAAAAGSGKTREPRRVEVGPRAARASGPAVKDSTAARQSKRKVVGAQAGAEKSQRYVNRPAPTLLGNRPKWVQDLFEAHFRSEMTLGLRRDNNRMKISRTDYAIGWLTLLDKIREDPSIARVRDGNGKA